MLLRDFNSDPDGLERHSFTRRDEATTDSVRWVWFERKLNSADSQLYFLIRIEFELTISDDPGARYRDNCSYSFNRVVLEVQRMKLTDEPNAEGIAVFAEYALSIGTLREVKQLANLLQSRSRFGRSA